MDFKEYMRKQMVSLKRNPNKIPLIMLVISCIVYTFNLSAHSQAMSYASANIGAFYLFLVTLCSMLVIFSFMNVSGKKGKAKIAFIALVYFLLAAQIVLDILYIIALRYQLYGRENPVPRTSDIDSSLLCNYAHIVLLVLCILSIALLPFYHKLLLRVNTTPKSSGDSAQELLKNTDLEIDEQE